VNPNGKQAFLCDGVRTPIGKFGGALASVRPDDLAAHVLRALRERNPSADWEALDDVYFGCANQAGEDNRNVARMALLLAGFPERTRPSTVCAGRAWTQSRSSRARSRPASASSRLPAASRA